MNHWCWSSWPVIIPIIPWEPWRPHIKNKKSKNSEKENSKINSASIIPWCSQTTSQCKKTGLHRCSVPCWLKPSLPCQPYPDSHMVNPTGSTQREMDLLWSCSHVSWIGMVNPLVKLVWFMIGKIHIFRFQGNSHDPLLNYPSQPAEGNAPFFLDLLVFHGFPNMAGRFSFFLGCHKVRQEGASGSGPCLLHWFQGRWPT